MSFYDDFVDFFTAVNYEKDVRCIILTSSGKHFTAGLDLKETAPSLLDTDEDLDTARKGLRFEQKLEHMQRAFTAVEKCRFPVVAGVHGGCIGAGVDLITACDIVYCTDNTFFSIKEVDVAMIADLGTLQRLPIIASNWSLMKEYCLTGVNFPAEEGLKLGIVSKIFQGEEQLHSR
jgi:enoyl-CoA hydratase/carnithine racemase